MLSIHAWAAGTAGQGADTSEAIEAREEAKRELEEILASGGSADLEQVDRKPAIDGPAVEAKIHQFKMESEVISTSEQE